MTVHEAIVATEQILPGTPAPKTHIDSRWQAIIAIGEFIEIDTGAVWAFAAR